MRNASLLRGQHIVCFSSVDWKFIWQGHQEIMSTLAANGNQVLFVENTGVRAPSIRDLPRVWARIQNWWRGTKGFRRERDNLFVYSPLILPFPYLWVARRINRALLMRALTRWMRAAGFNRPMIWTFLPTPLIRDLIRGIDPVLSVYYCIDDLASSSAGARRITPSEEQLFREVDFVFVTSDGLRRRAAQHARRVHLFPFGVSYERFERVRRSTDEAPADLRSIPRPIVGYVGGLHQWMDFELIAQTATRMPDVSFVLVGPRQCDTTSISLLPNVHLLGARSHDELPSYIKGFDLGLVPYRSSAYTANVYPTKLNEYLAMGIPVVATDLPEIRRFNAEHGPCVAVATGPGQMVEAITTALEREPSPERERRIAIARENSWQARIAKMSALIVEALDRSEPAKDRWEKVLLRLYQRARRRAGAAVVAVVFLYVMSFETSLPWMMAEFLREADAPRPSHAIVVFAGGVGESGEAGGGYQERVKQAIDLYQAGYAPRLIFSSGYEFVFPETQVMRDLAVSQGIPPQAILLESEAASTYEHVTRVHDTLDRHGWRQVLLVSSPYHMRRAMLTWRHVAPEIEVIPTPVPQSQFYSHARGASLEQLRGLLHEVAAIVVYWWRGWI